MAKTLSEAADKWEMNVKGKGQQYVEGLMHPRQDACAAFKKFVGSDSLAANKYCADYGRFLQNTQTYESIWTSAINNAIANNSYENGLKRGR